MDQYDQVTLLYPGELGRAIRKAKKARIHRPKPEREWQPNSKKLGLLRVKSSDNAAQRRRKRALEQEILMKEIEIEEGQRNHPKNLPEINKEVHTNDLFEDSHDNSWHPSST
mmetsp:Transcript_41679/g.65043  ORF Transcript_41679/g.65043 Transcript_41679/m.65043 type:complete len:112 (+) Transcript_41679:426-761(+)